MDRNDLSPSDTPVPNNAPKSEIKLLDISLSAVKELLGDAVGNNISQNSTIDGKQDMSNPEEPLQNDQENSVDYTSELIAEYNSIGQQIYENNCEESSNAITLDDTLQNDAASTCEIIEPLDSNECFEVPIESSSNHDDQLVVLFQDEIEIEYSPEGLLEKFNESSHTQVLPNLTENQLPQSDVAGLAKENSLIDNEKASRRNVWDVECSDEYDSDTTLPNVYIKNSAPSLKLFQAAEVKDTSYHSAEVRSFSPLPSTSNDKTTIKLNDKRFCEASANGSDLKSTSEDLTNDDIEVVDDLINDKSAEGKSLDNVIECSSESEESSKSCMTVYSKRKRRRNNLMNVAESSEVIDLEDCKEKADSDCEIIEVESEFEQKLKCMMNAYNFMENICNNKKKDVTSLALEPSADPEADKSNRTIGSLSSCESAAPNEVQVLADTENDVPLPEKILESAKSLIAPFFDATACVLSHLVLNKPKPKMKVRGRKRQRIMETVDLVSDVPPAVVSDDVIVIDSDVSIMDISARSNDSAVVPTLPVIPTALGMPTMSIVSAVPTFSTRPPMPDLMIQVPAPQQVYYVPHSPANTFQPCYQPPAQKESTVGDCPVCWESFALKSPVSTFCGHLFCLPCIKEVMKHSKKCPKCRKHLKGKGFHPIFI